MFPSLHRGDSGIEASTLMAYESAHGFKQCICCVNEMKWMSVHATVETKQKLPLIVTHKLSFSCGHCGCVCLVTNVSLVYSTSRRIVSKLESMLSNYNYVTRPSRLMSSLSWLRFPFLVMGEFITFFSYILNV